MSQQGNKYILKGLVSLLVVLVICVTLVMQIDPQDNVTGISVYDIVFNYLELCKGRVVPYGGSIDARKEDLYDYDRVWNLPGIPYNSTAWAKYIFVLIQKLRHWSVRLQRNWKRETKLDSSLAKGTRDLTTSKGQVPYQLQLANPAAAVSQPVHQA